MLNPLPSFGTRIWGNHVVEVNGEFTYVPREVTFLHKDGGLIWYSSDINPKPDRYGLIAKMGWYDSEFFYTEAESQENCDLLNQEAKGIITPRKQKEIDKIKVMAERLRQPGIYQILP